MRFTSTAFATAAVVLACASSAVLAEQTKNTTETMKNENGDIIEFITGTGDHDFDSLQRRAVHDSLRPRKHHHSSHSTHTQSGPDEGSELMASDGEVTWYASQDLKNPQCGDGQWSPNNDAHIGAVMYGWQGGPTCGEFIQICNDKMSGNPCIRVRIVDKCAACKKGHVDLTKSAFKQLAPSHSLNEGVVHNLKIYRSSKPAKWNLSLFGPFHLKG